MRAGIAAGVTQGINDLVDYQKDTPNREARQAEAQLIKQNADAKIKAKVPQVAAELQAEQLQAELSSLQRTQLQRATYDAFDRYESDKDVRHLNTFVSTAKKNPLGASMYSDMVRFDPLTDTAETRRQLARAGVDDVEAYLADPELSEGKVVITKADGSQHVVDMAGVYAMTGYSDYLGEKQLATLSKRADIQNALSGPQTAESQMIRDIAKEEDISLVAATQKYFGTRKPAGSGRTSTVERLADTFQEEDPELSRPDAIRRATLTLKAGSALERETERKVGGLDGEGYNEVYDEIKDKEQRTGARKQLDEAKSVRSTIDELAGGDFLGSEMTEANRRKVGPYITELEKLTDKSLTSDDKKEIRKLRNLIGLGETAGKLTPEQTGFIDNTLANFKKYFSDDATDIDKSSAYQTFANSLRNTLYGATLTAAEIEAFRAASGSMKQQLGPALAGLRTQLSTVKDNLQSIYDMNDEYVAQYYLGTSLDKAARVMDAIDERLELFTSLESEEDITADIVSTPNDTATPPAQQTRPSLDEIFGASK